MDFNNYSQLQASIIRALNRNDLEDDVPGFITLAEAEIRRQVRPRQKRLEITLDGGEILLPADCGIVKGLSITAPTLYPPIGFGTKQSVDAKRAAYQGTTGVPRAAAIIGREILLGPAPDQDYTAELTYLETFAALSATNDSNSVLAEQPDVYFYGSLIHSAPFLKDDTRLALWQGLFDRAVAQLNALRSREEFSATPQRARLPVVFG